MEILNRAEAVCQIGCGIKKILTDGLYCKQMPKQKASTVRFRPEDRRILKLMARKLGFSISDVLRMAIREKAERMGIE